MTGHHRPPAAEDRPGEDEGRHPAHRVPPAVADRSGEVDDHGGGVEDHGGKAGDHDRTDNRHGAGDRPGAGGRAGGRHRPARALVGETLRSGRKLAALAGWALVGALPTFAAGHALARATDDGFLAGRPATGLAWLGLLGLTVPLGAWGSRRTYLGVARLVEPLRDDLVGAVVTGALRRSTRTGAPRDAGAVARLTQHVEVVRDNVAGLSLLLLGFVASLVAALGGMVTLAPAVLPLVAGPVLASFVGFAATLPAITRQQRRALLAEEGLAELAGEVTEGLRDVVACGGEDRVAAALDARIDEQVAAGRSLARIASARTVIVAVGGQLPVILVLLSAGSLLRRGLTAGALLGTITYLMQGLAPAVSSVVGGIGAPLAQLLATIERIDASLPADAPADTSADAPGQVAGQAGVKGRGPGVPADAGLVLENVTFRYRADAEPVLDRLSLEVPDGDHLVVVGPSGAGKSTLAALVVGVLREESGAVLHGGVPAPAVFPHHRVLIPQQAYVFRGTLGENLRYLRPGAPVAALDAAVEAVGMTGLARRLGGYGAEVRPAGLSAGERQLVTLARAYLSSARLVVLDEATCHLDPAAEAVAEQAFAARGGTLVVVAHRISSARRGRAILVMDGRRALVGSHHDLVVRSPLYRELVAHWDDTPASREAPGIAPVP